MSYKYPKLDSNIDGIITRDKIIDLFSNPFWDSIPDKPSTFTPSAHTHTKSEISDFPSTMTPSTHGANHAPGGTDPVKTYLLSNDIYYSVGVKWVETSSYIKLYEIQIPSDFPSNTTIRIRVGFERKYGIHTCDVRVNEVSKWTPSHNQGALSSGYAYYSSDIAGIQPGDKIQFYGKTTGATNFDIDILGTTGTEQFNITTTYS